MHHNDVCVDNTRGEKQHSRPVASLLIMDGCFSQILDLFRGLTIGVPSGCLGSSQWLSREFPVVVLSIKIIMIVNVTLWSKLEYTR